MSNGSPPDSEGFAVASAQSQGVLRLLICAPSYAPAYEQGGPIRSLEGLSVALIRHGVDVRVLTTNARTRGTLDVPRDWTVRNSVPVKYLRRWVLRDVTPRYFPEALVLARGSNVVHTGAVFCTVTVQALLAAQFAGVPAVLSPRGAFEPASLAAGRSSLKRAWIRTFLPLLQRVACFHATSPSEARAICTIVGPGAPVEVVPNGTDIPTLARCYSARGTGTRIIAAMGRVHPNKGFDRLLRAVAILQQRGYDCVVRIAGPLEDRVHAQQLRDLISDLLLGGRAELVGEVSGIRRRDFFTDADVFVLPSHGTENFGNVVIEALAHGTPVVASDLTPWGHLEAQGCGVSVPNSPEGLADGIGRLLLNPAALSEAGRRGRELAERAYSWDAVIPQMLGLYRRAMGVDGEGHGCKRMPNSWTERVR